MNAKAQIAPISVFAYQSEKAAVKSRITLQQNLFSFLLEGEKTVYYAGTKVAIKSEQFLLLSAGNCLMSEKTASGNGRYKSVLISFDSTIISDFFFRHPELLQMKAGHHQEEPVLVFEKDAFLQNFIASLAQLLDNGKPLSSRMQLLKLDELLLYLGENYPGQLQKLRNIAQEANDEILLKQAVSASIDSRVTIEELAFLCHTSLSTFKRRFSKLYGTSPNKWLLEKRMEKAARLLRQGDHKANEICYELGYENLSSFIQSFKQVYGVTPKQYQLNIIG